MILPSSLSLPPEIEARKMDQYQIHSVMMIIQTGKSVFGILKNLVLEKVAGVGSIEHTA